MYTGPHLHLKPELISRILARKLKDVEPHIRMT